MKRLISTLVAICLLGLMPTASAGGSHLKRLGNDPAGDGPAALDVTYLDVGAHHGELEVRIGVDKMIPALGGYPELPGIEWTFDVNGRTFIAEAAVQNGQGNYYLFELQKDGSFAQLDNPTGTYDWADGYVSIIVPLEDIGAKSGTKISGTGPKGTEDVDSHVHAIATTYYPDYLATTKDFIVP